MRHSAVVVIALLTACASSRQGPPASRLELREQHRVYRVEEGDNAYKIAKAHGVKLDKLVELNELERPDRLAVGQELLIPGPRPKDLPVDLGQQVTPAPITKPTEPVSLDCTVPPRPDSPVSKNGFSWPVEGVVIARFGTIEGMPHEGLDIAAPTGTPVRAAKEGRVLFAGEQPGYGNLIIVSHADGRATVYANNEKNCVAAGADVKRGDVLGLVGATGGATSPRVYFELREGQRPVNPALYLPK